MSVTVEIPTALSRACFHGECTVGAFTYFNGKASLFHALIGRYCSIAPDVIIGPGEHRTDLFSTHPFVVGGARKRFKRSKEYDQIKTTSTQTTNSHQKTTIGSDVWIGARSYIAQGITINNGSIIGAGAIVTRNIPPYSIAVGSPARVIRTRFPQEIIQRLQELKWWNYSMSKDLIGELDYTAVEECISKIEKLKLENKLQPAEFKKQKLGGRRYQRILSLCTTS